MKKKELKKRLKQQKELNNKIVAENYELNERIKKVRIVRDELIHTMLELEEELENTRTASATMEKHYDSHMEIAENEIKRLNVIINYLETRDMK